MNDFRGPLPLDDRDFADVRRKVMAKIEKRRSPMIAWTFAAAAAIALIFVLIPKPQPAVAPHPAPLRGADLSPRERSEGATSPAGKGRGEAAGEGPVQVVVEKPPVKKSKPKPQLVASKSAGAPPSDEQITMNIQTDDPNVRIIWIARR